MAEKIFKIGIRIVLVSLIIFALYTAVTEINILANHYEPDIEFPMSVETVNSHITW
jgi:hypothetical protein